MFVKDVKFSPAENFTLIFAEFPRGGTKQFGKNKLCQIYAFTPVD